MTKWSILFPRTPFRHLRKVEGYSEGIGQWTGVNWHGTPITLCLCLPSLSRFLMYYWGSRHNKAKTSSFSVKARPRLQGDWGPGLPQPAGENHQQLQQVGLRREMGGDGSQLGPSLQLCMWLQRRGRPEETPAAREKQIDSQWLI